MSAQKINGKWHIVGKIKKDDGSYYNYKKVAVGCKTKTELSAFETDFRRNYQDIEISKKNISFKELCELMQSNDKEVKSVTKKTNKEVLDKVCRKIGDKKINLINRDILQKYINELENVYGKSYVSKIYYTIKKAFNYAVEQDMLVVNPIAKVKRSKMKDEVKKEILIWEPHHFENFILSVDDESLNAYFTFLYFMGTRKGEALALQWKDIAFDSKTVSIYKTVTNRIEQKAWEITSPKTKNSIRNISMPIIVIKSLEKLLINHKNIYGFNDECYVFGFFRPLANETVRRKFKSYILQSNIDKDGNDIPIEKQVPNIRIHDLRHSHASFLINNMSSGFTDFDIAKRLGDTVQTLHETYAHWFKQADKSIIDFMDQNI